MLRPFAGILIVVSAAAPTSAADADPTVSVRGVGKQAFEPDTVRVRWRVHASGKSAKSALSKLQASRAALETRLATLDDWKPTCHIGHAVDHGKGQGGMARFQAQAMVMAMGGGGDDEDKEEKPIRMAFTVTLEWKLAGASLAERQKSVDRIRQQLRDIEILGAKRDEDADDEDEDEESEPAARIRIEDGPTFYYVRRLTDAEADGVARKAFENARRRAARLATAAGRTLGPLLNVKDSIEVNQLEVVEQSSAVMSAMFGQSQPVFDDDADRPDTELVSDKLQPIRYSQDMTVTFRLN